MRRRAEGEPQEQGENGLTSGENSVALVFQRFVGFLKSSLEVRGLLGGRSGTLATLSETCLIPLIGLGPGVPISHDFEPRMAFTHARFHSLQRSNAWVVPALLVVRVRMFLEECDARVPVLINQMSSGILWSETRNPRGMRASKAHRSHGSRSPLPASRSSLSRGSPSEHPLASAQSRLRP